MCSNWSHAASVSGLEGKPRHGEGISPKRELLICVVDSGRSKSARIGLYVEVACRAAFRGKLNCPKPTAIVSMAVEERKRRMLMPVRSSHEIVGVRFWTLRHASPPRRASLDSECLSESSIIVQRPDCQCCSFGCDYEVDGRAAKARTQRKVMAKDVGECNSLCTLFATRTARPRLTIFANISLTKLQL